MGAITKNYREGRPQMPGMSEGVINFAHTLFLVRHLKNFCSVDGKPEENLGEFWLDKARIALKTMHGYSDKDKNPMAIQLLQEAIDEYVAECEKGKK